MKDLLSLALVAAIIIVANLAKSAIVWSAVGVGLAVIAFLRIRKM